MDDISQDFETMLETKKATYRQNRKKNHEESKILNDDRISFLMPTERTSTFLPQTGGMYSFGKNKRVKIEKTPVPEIETK